MRINFPNNFTNSIIFRENFIDIEKFVCYIIYNS